MGIHFRRSAVAAVVLCVVPLHAAAFPVTPLLVAVQRCVHATSSPLSFSACSSQGLRVSATSPTAPNIAVDLSEGCVEWIDQITHGIARACVAIPATAVTIDPLLGSGSANFTVSVYGYPVSVRFSVVTAGRVHTVQLADSSVRLRDLYAQSQSIALAYRLGEVEPGAHVSGALYPSPLTDFHDGVVSEGLVLTQQGVPLP